MRFKPANELETALRTRVGSISPSEADTAPGSLQASSFPFLVRGQGDLIPENAPVRVLNAIVDSLDITRIEDSYEGGGASSYHPRMLVKIVFYAHLQNVRSGRKMGSS